MATSLLQGAAAEYRQLGRRSQLRPGDRVVPNRPRTGGPLWPRTGGTLSPANAWYPIAREWVVPYAANGWYIIAREMTNKRRSGKTRRGNNWLRTALVEAAWAASRTKDTYLGAQFHRLRARRGDKRAAVAVAHSILIVVYHLLAKPEAVFTELGGDYFLKRNPEQEQRRAIRKLEALGFTVTLTPGAAAEAAAS